MLTLYPQPLSESEKRHFSKYGKLPHGSLLGKKSNVQRILSIITHANQKLEGTDIL